MIVQLVHNSLSQNTDQMCFQHIIFPASHYSIHFNTPKIHDSYVFHILHQKYSQNLFGKCPMIPSRINPVRTTAVN